MLDCEAILMCLLSPQLKVKPLLVPECRSTDPVIGGGALGGESVNEPGRRARATGRYGEEEGKGQSY